MNIGAHPLVLIVFVGLLTLVVLQWRHERRRATKPEHRNR